MVFEQIFGLFSMDLQSALFGGIFVFGIVYFGLEAAGLFNPVQRHHSAYEVLYAKVSDGFTWDSLKHFKIAFIILAVWIFWMLGRK